ncbi:hypothetical protein C8R47DRAFT_1135987 [Mycena vitilis]|nr:hypothetical protein C8R47DRAFT_1135987 [Mycena vitilis]
MSKTIRSALARNPWPARKTPRACAHSPLSTRQHPSPVNAVRPFRAHPSRRTLVRRPCPGTQLFPCARQTPLVCTPRSLALPAALSSARCQEPHPPLGNRATWPYSHTHTFAALPHPTHHANCEIRLLGARTRTHPLLSSQCRSHPLARRRRETHWAAVADRLASRARTSPTFANARAPRDWCTSHL